MTQQQQQQLEQQQQQQHQFRTQQAENSLKGDPSSASLPMRHRLPPGFAVGCGGVGSMPITMTSPMIALHNQFRNGYLDVLHEEEESSSVPSPTNVHLVENQQQLEQLNLHQANHNNIGIRHNLYDAGGSGGFLRCIPPSIVITGVGSRHGSGAVSDPGGGGAIAMR